MSNYALCVHCSRMLVYFADDINVYKCMIFEYIRVAASSSIVNHGHALLLGYPENINKQTLYAFVVRVWVRGSLWLLHPSESPSFSHAFSINRAFARRTFVFLCMCLCANEAKPQNECHCMLAGPILVKTTSRHLSSHPHTNIPITHAVTGCTISHFVVYPQRKIGERRIPFRILHYAHTNIPMLLADSGEKATSVRARKQERSMGRSCRYCMHLSSTMASFSKPVLFCAAHKVNCLLAAEEPLTLLLMLDAVVAFYCDVMKGKDSLLCVMCYKPSTELALSLVDLVTLMR